MTDIYIRYLRKYYNEHGTINDIPTTSEVEFEGEILKIGNFLGNTRKRYKEYLAGKRKFSENVLLRFQELNTMNFEWTPRKSKSENLKETDPYIKYLVEHYKEFGTINDIKKETEVEFEGKRLCIGSFLSGMRINHKHYVNNDKTPGSSSKKAIERYRILEELKIEWESTTITEREEQKDDKRFRYLRKHYEEFGTINDITTDTVVEFEGEELRIGSFFDYIRRAHKIYIEQKDESFAYSERSLKRYALLDELEFDWNPVSKRTSRIDNDRFILYLRKHYNEFGTINDIAVNEEVEFEGEILKIGSFLATMRKRYETHREGFGHPEELALARYKALNEMHFEWTPTKTKAENVKSKDPYIKYLRRHYNLFGTINDIPKDMEVEFESKKLRIGSFITSIRVRHRHYLNGDKTPGCGSKTSLERYKVLEQLKIEWEPRIQERRKKLSAEDRHLRYLREYYEEHGTINDIPVKTIVMFEGEPLNIGNFLLDIRAAHRIYTSKKEGSHAYNELALKRYEVLDEMDFDWNPGAKRGNVQDDDIYIRYIQLFYLENGSLDDITLQDMVEFEGQVLRIRDFISNIKTRHSYYEKGINKNGSFSTRALKRYEILDSMNFNWQSKKSEVAKLAKEHNIPQNTLYDNLNRFDGNLAKALAICLRNRKLKEEKETLKSAKYKLSDVLKEFDINIETLISHLNRKSIKTKEQDLPLIYDENMSLMEFCTKNGYNYNVIVRAVRLKKANLCDESLESLINRCLIDFQQKGQKSPSTWIYSKYGNELLIKHMLTYIGASSSSVLRDMSWYIISIEEALQREAFRKHSKNKFNYLEGIYNDFIAQYQEISSKEEFDEEAKEEKLVLYMELLVKEYHLSKDEFNIIKDAFNQYADMIYQYHLFDVAFEKDNNKRLQKIITYRFDEDDIEEAFFIPLKFEEKVLLGKNSELYKRRTILKNITVSWPYLTQEEKDIKVKTYGLTEEEVEYVTSTRKCIDETKEKVTLIKK